MDLALRSSIIRRRAFHSALWLVAAAFAAGAAAQTQSAASPKAFDVAAIKPNKTGSNSTSMRTSHGTLSASNVTARTLIVKAFNLRENQVTGGPDWVDSDRFDVSAKTDDQSISDDDLWLSLQPLLIDRFHLKFHRETKQEPVLSLVAAKVKPALAPHSGGGQPSMRISIGGGKASMKASNVSMTKLASSLSVFTGRAVIDNTQLKGGFDFTLEWAQDHPEESTLSSIEESLGVSGPALDTALREQLGLNLQHATGPVEHVIVDTIDRPTAN